jgi:hypothetical protein
MSTKQAVNRRKFATKEEDGEMEMKGKEKETQSVDKATKSIIDASRDIITMAQEVAETMDAAMHTATDLVSNMYYEYDRLYYDFDDDNMDCKVEKGTYTVAKLLGLPESGIPILPLWQIAQVGFSIYHALILKDWDHKAAHNTVYSLLLNTGMTRGYLKKDESEEKVSMK